jgi:STE24 endopeptidase
MNYELVCVALTTVLILARWAAQLWLEHLNQRHVLTYAADVPDAFKGHIDAAAYATSVQYTLAKSRFGQLEDTYRLGVLLVVLFSGVLPRGFEEFTAWLGSTAWATSAFLFITGVMLVLPGLPFDWYSQFRLEARFGFNTCTLRLWWTDRLKGLLVGLALGYPLLMLVLKLVEWAGRWWWLWAWVCVLAFQLLMIVIAPVLILPLFNKLTALPEGSLRDRLFALAARTGFRARSIQVMDGSKRSRHSNAFFTGFGRIRKIVLFDTLLQQLTAPELEAVLAHEIGHYKKKHIVKMLLWSAASSLIGFYALFWLAQRKWFYQAFGFPADHIAPALLLFALLSGVATFWLAPLLNFWSRRHEYQADAYAAQAIAQADPLIGALRKLSEKNLSNLMPHPLYSGFYYSHPTLLERERALARPAP